MRISVWSADVCSSDLVVTRMLASAGAGSVTGLRYNRRPRIADRAIAMSEPPWMYENFEPAGSAIGYRVTRKLDAVQSPLQKIEIYESTDWGNLLLIEGAMTLTTRNNLLYNEMTNERASYRERECTNTYVKGEAVT